MLPNRQPSFGSIPDVPPVLNRAITEMLPDHSQEPPNRQASSDSIPCNQTALHDIPPLSLAECLNMFGDESDFEVVEDILHRHVDGPAEARTMSRLLGRTITKETDKFDALCRSYGQGKNKATHWTTLQCSPRQPPTRGHSIVIGIAVGG